MPVSYTQLDVYKRQGVDRKTAEHDACNIEHVISAESFRKLKEAFEE